MLHGTDTDFIAYIRTEGIYSGIAKGVETRFDDSNYELVGPLPKGKNEKVIALMKDESSEKIMTEFAALRAKTYSYSTDNKDEDKKPKGTKKCVIKRKLKLEDYKHCLEPTQLENKINHLQKRNLNVDNLRENHKEFIKTKI